jgi:hypothetical protein
MKAIYSAERNEIQEQPTWTEAAYAKTIPCSEECRTAFKDGQILEGGVEYELKDFNNVVRGETIVFVTGPNIMAYPVKSNNMKRQSGFYDVKYKGVWTSAQFRHEYPNYGWELKRHPVLLTDRDLDEIDETKQDNTNEDELIEEFIRFFYKIDLDTDGTHKEMTELIKASNFIITKRKP